MNAQERLKMNLHGLAHQIEKAIDLLDDGCNLNHLDGIQEYLDIARKTYMDDRLIETGHGLSTLSDLYRIGKYGSKEAKQFARKKLNNWDGKF